MGINDIVATAFSGFSETLARLRRCVIAYIICGICIVVAVIMAMSASILALEAAVGAIYARLIVAGVFLVIAAASVIMARVGRSRPAAEPAPSADAERKSQASQIALIVEAAMLGYSLSSRTGRRSKEPVPKEPVE